MAAATAPMWIRNAVPVLDTPVYVAYVPVIPRVVAGFLGPVVEVVPVTAGPDHPVDAGSSPDGLARAWTIERLLTLGLRSAVKFRSCQMISCISFTAQLELT
jgi:hypothetical protein